MIEKVTAYKASDGETFEELSEVQRHEIETLLSEPASDTQKVCDKTAIDVVAKFIVHNSEKIIDILTTKSSSRVKARKANGATRKTRQAAAAQALALPSTK